MSETLRLLLAGILLVAAAGKLADPTGSRRALLEFGVRPRLAGPAALGVPLLELAVAAGLVAEATARAAAVAAAGLLAVFAAAIGVALLRGRRPDCGCFGRLHSSAAGPATLARNLALAAVAALVAVAPGGDPGWVHAGVAALTIAVAGQAALSVVLLRRYGRALHRLDELAGGLDATVLAAGSLAPPFSLPSVSGGVVRLQELLTRGRPVLLVFAETGCGPCRALLPTVAGWQRDAGLTVAVVMGGDAGESVALAKEHGLEIVLTQTDREVTQLYEVTATPSAALVGTDGRLVDPPAAGRANLETLVAPFLEPVERRAVRPGLARVAGPALAGGGLVVAATAAAATGAVSAEPGTRPLAAVLETLHRQLGGVADRLYRALRTLPPPEPGRVVAAPVARWAAEGRFHVVQAQIAVRHLPKPNTATAHVLEYLAALQAGFTSFQRAAATQDLDSAARRARSGAAEFGKASEAIKAVDRVLGCPYGCGRGARRRP